MNRSRIIDAVDVRDLFAYTVCLRRRLLAALATVPFELLRREVGTNHRSILQTLIHVMAVEESWVREDLEGKPPLEWEEFRDRYLGGEESVDSLRTGWQSVTQETIGYLAAHPGLDDTVEFDAGGTKRTVTAEQVLYHVIGEEMIHLGEVLAMTRQLGIDLPDYFLMSVMNAADHPWDDLLSAGEPV